MSRHASIETSSRYSKMPDYTCNAKLCSNDRRAPVSWPTNTWASGPTASQKGFKSVTTAATAKRNECNELIERPTCKYSRQVNWYFCNCSTCLRASSEFVFRADGRRTGKSNNNNSPSTLYLTNDYCRAIMFNIPFFRLLLFSTSFVTIASRFIDLHQPTSTHRRRTFGVMLLPSSHTITRHRNRRRWRRRINSTNKSFRI